MPEHPGTTPSKAATAAALGIRYAALSDTGRVRESNQDALYAGSRLLAVADGFGSGGGPASAAAVEAFRRLEPDAVAAPAGELLNALEDTLAEAGRAVRDVAESGAAPDAVHSAAPGAAHDEVGTTLTALLWTGSRLALVHIGDSRAYVLRGGGLFQITHDHTVVQTMVDEGRLTPEEAASHPQRALLARALTGHGYGTRPGYGTGHGTGTVPDPDPDPNPNPNPNPNPGPDAGTGAELRLHDALPGDRYLLCSDGLSAVVPVPEVRTVLASVPEPRDAVRALVDLANRAGGPDNVSCVVADVVTSG
ncbi:serine/threonine-protein phosphatase [Streptomyces albus subsp. chlorinus]|nr:serine/threonine-protein phosphatase [Streptomyces albus subsp. chlorinus]